MIFNSVHEVMMLSSYGEYSLSRKYLKIEVVERLNKRQRSRIFCLAIGVFFIVTFSSSRDTISTAFEGSQRGAILTTHYMEEADALCSRVGIMVLGQLRSVGSLIKSKLLVAIIISYSGVSVLLSTWSRSLAKVTFLKLKWRRFKGGEMIPFTNSFVR